MSLRSFFIIIVCLYFKKQRLRFQIDWRQKEGLIISLGHSAYITFYIIMLFRKPCHMPFRKLIPPITLTASIRQRLKFWFRIP